MIVHRYCLFFLSFLIHIHLFAQPINGLKSSGAIPDEIYSSTIEKTKAKIDEISKINKHESRSVRLSQVQFYKSSYFVIDAVKNNAGIYVNDELTAYLNNIADYILKNEPELRSKLHFYAYRSPYANAFSTDQGDIFVNVGLIAYLNNEAELAFVLCHEIIHYIKSHNITSVTERKKAENGVGKYKDLQIEKSIEAVHDFSKDLEKEADLAGLKFYLNSDYDTSAVESAFEVLRKSNFLYRNDIFFANEIATPFFTIPHNYLKEEKIKVHEEEEEIEEKEKEEVMSTHPNIDDRISYSNEYISAFKSNSTKCLKFKFKTEQEFIALKRKAQETQCYYYYEKSLYAKAFYTAYLLYKESHDQQFLKVMANCMISLNQLRAQKLALESKMYDLGEGNQYPVYYLFYKLKTSAFNCVNFAFNYGLYKQNPTDSFYYYSTLSSLKIMAHGLGQYWLNYNNKGWDTSKIKNASMNPILPYLKIAFTDSFFLSNFGKISDYNIYCNVETQDEESKPMEEKAEIHPDNILIVNPFYIRYDENIEGKIDFNISYTNETYLLNQLKYVVDFAGKNAKILDVRCADKSDASIFDDIALTTSYFNKYTEIELNSDLEVRPYSNEVLNEVMTKYNSDYLMYIGVRTYKGEMRYKFGVFLINILSPSFLPYSIQMMIQREREFGVYYIIIDPKTHKIVQKGERLMTRVIDNNNTLSISLYDIFRKI